MDRTALLLIDVVNPFDFDGAEALLERARPASHKMAALARRARAAGAPVVYVNDNFAEWTASFDALIERCAAEGAPGAEICRRLRPEPGDYHVLKPRYSGFFQSPLESLLDHLGVGRVVLAGVATDMCVLATALDARTRELAVVVPRDASAAETDAAHDGALDRLRESLGVETPLADGVSFAAEPVGA